MIKTAPLKMMPIDKLKPQGRNVKVHTKEQIDALAKIMSNPKIGFNQPIVIDRNNNIWAGHGRLEAAKKLGMKEMPTVYLGNLTEDEKKAYMIMENRINESPWNTQNLELILEEIKFDFKPYQMTFDDVLGIQPMFREEKDAMPKISENPRANIGDVYQLGKHRIMCGDARKLDQVRKLLGTAKIDSLQTDPPYGVEVASKNDRLNRYDGGNRISIPLLNDGYIQNYQEFITGFLRVIPFAEKNTIYLWYSDRRALEVRSAFQQLGFNFHQNLIWVKNNHALANLDHNPKHETCLYGWSGKHKFYGTPSKTSVYEYDKPLANKEHPTSKPIELIREFVMEGSALGAIIYDPFLGSGTVLIICEQINRICYGMELEPRYVDVTVQRWENFTGKKAKLMNQ